MAQAYSGTEVVDRAYLLADEISGGMATAASAFGLTFPRMQVLFVLGREKGVIQRDIAHHLRCSPRQVTALVDGLEASGHVVRTTPEGDRRRRVLSLTDAGRAVVSAFDEGRIATAEAWFGGLDPADVQAFGRVADHVIALLGPAALSRLPGA